MSATCDSSSASSIFDVLSAATVDVRYHRVLQAPYVVAPMVKQQPHFKVFPLWQPRAVFSCECVSVRVCTPS